jgi:uncharacterized protein involved in outer membrane biogenesis
MNIVQKLKTLSRVKKIALTVALLFLGYTFFGFLVFPWIVRLVAVHQLPKVLHRPTVIEKVRFNPFTFALEVQGLAISEPKGTDRFLSFDRLYVNVQASSIFKLAPVVREFRLEKPYVRLVRNQDATYNFSDLLSSAETKTPSAPQPSPPAPAEKPAFCFYNIQIVDGAADILDEPVAKTHEMRNLNLGVPFVSSIGQDIEVFVQPHFSVNVNGKPISIQGQTKPFSPSLETTFDIALKGLDLPYYFAYAPKEVPVTLTSGSLDVALQLSFVQPQNEERKLILSGDVAVQNIALVDKAQRPLFKFGSLTLTIAPSQLFARKPHVAKIALQSPEVVLIRDASGILNVNSLAPPAAQSPEPTSPPEPALPVVLTLDEFTVDDARALFQDYRGKPDNETPEEMEILRLPHLALRNSTIDTGQRVATVGEVAAEQGAVLIRKLKTGELSLQALAPPAPTGEAENSGKAESGAPWVATLEKLSIKDFAVQGENLAPLPGGDLSLTAISLEGQGITTQAKAKSTMSFSTLINQKAPLDVRGEFSLDPLAADLQVSLSKLKLAWFEPFFADKVALSIPKGEFSTAGKVSVSLPEGTPMQATFRGDAGMADFIAVDKKDAEDILKWKQLQINGIDFSLAPLVASVDTVSLDNFAARIVRNADQSLNLQHLVVEAEKSKEALPAPVAAGEPANPAPAEPEKAEAPRIQVKTIALKRGTVNFSDRAVTPTFYTKLTEIQGEVTGISSEENATANVDITAKCDGYAPIAIKGSARPLSKDLYLDLATQLRGLDMTIFSTYTGKYVGHTIGEGKLGLDLRYHIEGQALTSENVVSIDTFNFGQEVQSPDDLKLPVKLAVSLLKDRNGKIGLDLPVSGRLDDPQFSIFGIIMKVLKNILVKAATAPFSLLSSLFGGGEDLSYLEFTPGRASLTDALKEKLAKLATALNDRPNLQVRVVGYVDPEQDREGLISYRFERQVKAQKLRDLSEAETATDQIDAVTIEPEEREKYLKKAYKAADFKKPKNLVGLAKDLPAEEMEKLMRENLSVTDEDLAMLAQERSQTVVGYLTEQGKIEANRVFLVRPKSLTPEGKIENAPNYRVELLLK